jgi:hypothetical protein
VGISEGKNHLEDLGVDGDNIRMDPKEMWTGLVWLRIRTSGLPLCSR